MFLGWCGQADRDVCHQGFRDKQEHSVHASAQCLVHQIHPGGRGYPYRQDVCLWVSFKQHSCLILNPWPFFRCKLSCSTWGRGGGRLCWCLGGPPWKLPALHQWELGQAEEAAHCGAGGESDEQSAKDQSVNQSFLLLHIFKTPTKVLTKVLYTRYNVKHCKRTKIQKKIKINRK